MRFAEVVVLMMDAQHRFEEQDLRIADLIEREGRALVIAVNKWDLMDGKHGQISALRGEVDHLLPQVAGVPIVAVSGLMGEGIDRLMEAIVKAYAVWNKRVPTAALNRWFEQAVDSQSAAGGLGPAAQAELHHPDQGAAAELRAVLLARRRGAAVLPALSHQFAARGFRPARHADAHHAAREGQSVRAQAQAAVMSDRHVVGSRPTSVLRRCAAPWRGRGGLHLRHDPARHARARPDHADPAQARRELCRQRYCARRRIFGLFGTAWALMQFVFSPVLGSLSDRFGRSPVVLVSNFGLAADYVLMALAPSLPWLFVGRMISGITSASISTAFAYIADLTPPERRAAMFGKIGAAFGAGFILGPALGGLLGDIDPRLPFWAAAGLSFTNALYGLLILPESLPPERRAPFRWRNANPVGALQLLRSDRVLAGLSIANFIAQIAHVVLPSTFVLYATYRYGWDTKTVGLTLAARRRLRDGGAGRGVGPIVRVLGERGALMLGLCCGAIGFLIFGLAPTGRWIWFGIPVMALWGVSGAATQALMTRLVAPDKQGQLQGATSSVQSVAQLVGPVPVHADLRLFHRGERAGASAWRAVPAGVAVADRCARDRDVDAAGHEARVSS